MRFTVSRWSGRRDYFRIARAYRVHRLENCGIDFANSESNDKAPKALTKRWAILRQMARARLGIELPSFRFYDFSLEKSSLLFRRLSGAVREALAMGEPTVA